jgi:hypothetical protein
MSLSKNRIVALLAVTTVLGCSSPRSRSVATKTASPDYVTSAEIAATPASSAYDLIARLRPRWLKPLPAGSLRSVRSQVIVVYVDGVKIGPTEGLRSISASSVTTMQYYDATRAATVVHDVGSEPIAGAIVITTTRVQ